MYKQLLLAFGQPYPSRMRLGTQRVLLSLLLASISVGLCRAELIYTDTATFDVTGQLPAVGPPIPLTSLISFSDTGRNFINSTGTNVAGTEVRSVGASLLATVKHVGGAETGAPIGSGGQAMVAVFGMLGEFTSSTDISFSAGTLRLFELPVGTNFVADDATTWGTNGTLLASYTLATPGAVIDGNTLSPPMGTPEPISLLTTDVNVTGANTAVGATSQSVMLFNEQAPGLLTSDSGLAMGLPAPTEGALTSLDQELIDPGNIDIVPSGESVLNQIALDSFGSVFADFGNGGVVDFGPETNAGTVTDTNNTGFDLVVNLGGNLVPTLSVTVPEPQSLATVVSLLVAVSLCWQFNRRQ